MDTEVIKVSISFASLLLAIVSMVYAHYRTKDSTLRKQIAALTHDLTELKSRISVSEIKLEETPTSKAIHELAVSIEHLSGDLRAAVARLDGLSDIVARLEKAVIRQENFTRGLGRQS